MRPQLPAPALSTPQQVPSTAQIAMLKTIVDSIDGKLDKVATKEDVKELKDDVGYIAEKVTENSIQKNEDQDQY